MSLGFLQTCGLQNLVLMHASVMDGSLFAIERHTQQSIDRADQP
jgi:hypothetical protein